MLSLILGVLLIGMSGFVVAETTCEDSDDLDYSSAGETVVTVNNSGTLTVSDTCLKDTVVLLGGSASVTIQALLDSMVAAGLITEDMITNENILLEGSCPSPVPEGIGNPLPFQVAYECPNGCSAGACLAEDEDDDEGETEDETNNNAQQGLGQMIRNRVSAGTYISPGGQQIRVRELAQNRIRLSVGNGSVDCDCDQLNLTQEQVQNRTRLNVALSNGRDAEIKIMPDVASTTALQRLRLKVCNESRNCSIELKEVGKGNQTKLVYEARAKKTFRIFGFIKNRAEVRTQIDAETGEEIETKRPWWAWLASEREE